MRHFIALLTATSLVALPAASMAQGAHYLSQSDVAEARQQHSAIVAEFGGAETGARGAYVESVGRKVAAYSGVANANQAYHFTALNSAVENAFAVPGGYVYITRQLMSLMGDEAELAFVLGHETGHIAADHSRQRQSATSRNSILGVLGAVLGSVIGNNVFGQYISQAAEQFAQFQTLKFSRDQEYQADQLGVRYITQAGYDPAAGATMLAALTRATALEARVQGKAGRSTPEWASTHPLSENRTQQAFNLARQTGRAGIGLRNRDAFLAQLNGITVDDDPAQGVIDGRSFTHPNLKLQFMVPAGFRMQNGAHAVTIEGSSGKAQFSGGRFDGNFQTYIAAVLNELTEGKVPLQVSPIQRTSVNGLPAAYLSGRANTGSGVVDVSVFAYQWDRDTAYHFIMITRGGAGVGPFSTMVSSLRRISPAEAAAIHPRIISVVRVKPGDTVQSLAGRMAYRDYQTERFLSLNGLGAGARLTPGQPVKLIVFGARRS